MRPEPPGSRESGTHTLSRSSEFDVLVVGGGLSGLGAALGLVRARRSVLGQGDISNLSGRDIRHNVRVLLALLVADEHFDGPALDEFLASARKLA